MSAQAKRHTTQTERTIRFYTDAAIEVTSVTADQMREVDRVAMEETGPNLFQMMENAGRNLALIAIEVLGKGWAKANVVVLAGSGGNGGGGVCAARHLANRSVNVKLCLTDPDPMHLGEVPSFQRKIFHHTRGQEIPAVKLDNEPVDLILDALIGYGLRSAPQGTAADLIQWANHASAPILALDVPSGVNATTGQTPGKSIKPRWTVTLALPKTGLLPEKTGELFVADIGIPEGTYRRIGLAYQPPFGNHFWVRLNAGEKQPEACR